MKAVVFLLCLCSFLFFGNDRTYGSAPHHNRYSAHQNNRLQKFTLTCQNKTTVSITSSHDDEFIIADEVEDENTNTITARKFKLITRRYFILNDTFILSYLNTSSRDQHSFHGQLPYRYISQRVLRI